MRISVASFIDANEFPDNKWEQKAPSEVNIDPKKVKKLFDLSFEDSATQAVVLIKNGVLIGEQYADGFDENSYGTPWSMAKSFYAALIGISIDRGEINSLCLLYTSPSPRDGLLSRMPSSA